MRIDGLPADDPQRADVTADAVVVIPGIMGSELVDSATQRVLWGIADPRWFVDAWLRPDGLAPLALTSEERKQIADGTYRPGTARVKPTRLLRLPAAAPFLGGFEPYTFLLRRVRQVVVHPDAVLEFPYDWRLPIALNTRLLADTVRQHLAGWRAHPALAEFRRRAVDDRPVGVVIVAHSMGGLLARGLSLIPGATADVRATITLGTPFYGSVKAAMLLNGAGPVPLPRQRLRQMAATMPGIYDLLPTYRCLLTTGVDGHDDVIRLTPKHVGELGGDIDLADAAFAYHQRLDQAVLIGHRAIVGTEQPTPQSLRIADGMATAAHRSYLWHDDGELKRDPVGQLLYKNYKGDGTVYRYAASPQGTEATGLAQTHGALAASAEAAAIVRAILTDQGELGIRLGVGDLGLDLPDIVTAGERFDITVLGEEDPAAVTCVITAIDSAEEHTVAHPLLAAHRDGEPGLSVTVRLPEPGLYRISVKTGGRDPVTQLVICIGDQQDLDD